MALAITTGEACRGRLTLGIGASHKPTVEQRFGLSFDRPVAYHRDYLDVLMPVLAADEAAKTEGMVRSTGGANRKVLQAVPVRLAALGPAMLQLVGARTAGTTTWMVGPRTLADHVVPTIAAAAAAAGMASPRVVAGVPILVTDGIAGGRALARTTFAGYGTRPSYQSSLAREGWSAGGEAAVVGDEAAVTAALADYAAAGVIDLAAVEFGTDSDDRARTRAVLVALAGWAGLTLTRRRGFHTMDQFEGRIAVITGGGSGMGRELAVLLAAQGCHVAMCDLSEANLAESRDLCLAGAPAGTQVTTHRCNVAEEAQVLAFRDEVLAQHDTDHVHLVFNNAGIGGGGSFLEDPREVWETTFAVCWFGVYYCSRAFVPLLVAAPEGHLVNTSSVNGFWASIGPTRAHTAYAAAKFAVKGFSEALVTDLRLHAPHVKVSVVMPGHIGTGIALNSVLVQGGTVDAEVTERAAAFRNTAPTSALQAAEVILAGVRAGRWRILVGEDAHTLDQLVRDTPEEAYDEAFADRLVDHGVFGGILR